MAVLLRSLPEDFEVPLVEPCGVGEHTYLWIEKRGRTTDQVARELAAGLGVSPHDVAYAGRKDRHAVTRQWFSVPGVSPERALAVALADARVLEAVRHRHKLRTGDLRGNRFTVRLRGTSSQQRELAARRLAEIAERGCSNRFGEQRFGRLGDNAARGAALLAGGERVRDRRLARLLLSALQSAVFNRVLELRAAPLHVLRRGELAVVHQYGGVLRVDEPDALAEPLRRFEVSPTGPLFGSKMMSPAGEAAEEEARAMAELGVPRGGRVPPPAPGLHLPGARRAVRMRPEEAALDTVARDGSAGGGDRSAEGDLVVRFVLPPGCYATVLLAELLPGVDFSDAEDGG